MPNLHQTLSLKSNNALIIYGLMNHQGGVGDRELQ